MFNVEEIVVQSLEKHRDYSHKSFSGHLADKGDAFYNVGRQVKCDIDPVTQSILSPSDDYYEVEVTLTGKVYTYLVPAESDKSEPNRKTVLKAIQDCNDNPVEGGRKTWMYIDQLETAKLYPEKENQWQISVSDLI